MLARFAFAALLAAPGALWAQPGRGMMMGPVADSPVVEFRGKIVRVQASHGAGMPLMEVRRGEETVKVYLGSMRYLMEQNFNPKAGAEITVKGYQVAKDVVAITVATGGKTLRLRDEDGRPVWMGGPHRRGGRE